MKNPEKHKIFPKKFKEKSHSPSTKVLTSNRNILMLLIGLALFIITTFAFGSLRDHEFINLDDYEYVVQNPNVQSGLTLNGLIWAFTTTHAANFHPLTWLSHMLDCQLYGLNPSGHHLTNLLFHIASTFLLFFILERMTGAIWRSSLVAVFFGIHPLHVESVAWIAERKDVLSAFFWVLTMWAYIRYTKRPGLKRYLYILLSFTLGLLSKPMLVTLPFVLLLLDLWPLGRLPLGQSINYHKFDTIQPMNVSEKKSVFLHLIWEKIPLFLLTFASSIITVIAQKGAILSLEYYPLWARIANALVSYVSYGKKMIWPSQLAVYYPFKESLPLWKVGGSILLLVFISLLVIRTLRKIPYLSVGWFWYLGTLVPVIGLVQVGTQAMADRYMYIPMIGLLIMIIWGSFDILMNIFGQWPCRKLFFYISCCFIISIMLITTRLQVKHWKNSITLYEHTLSVTSNNFIIHDNIGLALVEKGKITEAISHFYKALQIKPDAAKVHYSLGLALAGQKRIHEARLHFTEALRIKPDYAEAHVGLGVTFFWQENVEEAIAHFKKAIQINPSDAKAHLNLGLAYLAIGDKPSALEEYNILKKINPNLAKVLYENILK